MKKSEIKKQKKISTKMAGKIMNKIRLINVEEDGEDVFFAFPVNCSKFGCDGKVKESNGLMCCTKCGCSYGTCNTKKERKTHERMEK